MFSTTRERLARLEIDPFDHPFSENESAKISTTINMPVEPWPKRKLKELYMLILDGLKEIPADAGYRKLTEELVR